MKTILIAACLCLSTLPAHAFQLGAVIPEGGSIDCIEKIDDNGTTYTITRTCYAPDGPWKVSVTGNARTGELTYTYE